MTLSTGVAIAYDHAGGGGFPLLLIHGWPETRRIWSRNIEPLAEAGFEVIAPDLRGFGDSGLAPDDRYDAAAHARDMQALLEHLGHDRCVVSAGDLGGVVAQDLSLRFDGLVRADGPVQHHRPVPAGRVRGRGAGRRRRR